MMKARKSLQTGIALLALAVWACSTPPPATRPLGAAKRAVEVRQTANPERGEKPVNVEGTGATTSAEILNNYHTNQKTDVQERRQDRQRDRGISEVGGQNN